MSTVRDAVNRFVLRVREIGSHGTSEPTVRSLIGPFFASLGHDGADPRVDSVVTLGGSVAVSVEAASAGAGSPALAAAFAADPGVTLGIAIAGTQWRFFTDLVETRLMDQDPFARWDVVADEVPPMDLLALIQNTHLGREEIHALARQERAQARLLADITTLLSPSSSFTKLAIAGVAPEAAADYSVPLPQVDTSREDNLASPRSSLEVGMES